MKSVVAIAVATFVALAHAEPAADACKPQMPSAPLADRSGTIASLQQLPDSCLKKTMMECHRATTDHVLDLGTAAMCSMNYEALMRKSFGGDFQAMLAWWQRERARAVVQ